MDAFGDVFRSISHLQGRRGPTDTQLLMMRMMLNSIHAESRRRIYNSTAPNHLELDEDSAFTTTGMYVDRMERRLFENFPCLLLLEEDLSAFNWAVYLFTQCSYTAQGAVNSALEVHSAGRNARRHWRDIRRQQVQHLRRVRSLRPQPVHEVDGALLRRSPTAHQPRLPPGLFEYDAEWVDDAIESLSRFLHHVETLDNLIRSRPSFNMREIMDDDSVPGRDGIPEFLRDLPSERVVPALVREFWSRGERAPQATPMVDGPRERTASGASAGGISLHLLPDDVASATPPTTEQRHMVGNEAEGDDEIPEFLGNVQQQPSPGSPNDQTQSTLQQDYSGEGTPDTPQQSEQENANAQVSGTSAEAPDTTTPMPPLLPSSNDNETPQQHIPPPGSQALTPGARRLLTDFCHHQLRATTDETREFSHIDWNSHAGRTMLTASEHAVEGLTEAERVTEEMVGRLVEVLRQCGRVEGGKVIFELEGGKEGFLGLLNREGRAGFAKWVGIGVEEFEGWDGVLVLK